MIPQKSSDLFICVWTFAPFLPAMFPTLTRTRQQSCSSATRSHYVCFGVLMSPLIVPAAIFHLFFFPNQAPHSLLCRHEQAAKGHVLTFPPCSSCAAWGICCEWWVNLPDDLPERLLLRMQRCIRENAGQPKVPRWQREGKSGDLGELWADLSFGSIQRTGQGGRGRMGGGGDSSPPFTGEMITIP